jgi:hypothetical protein
MAGEVRQPGVVVPRWHVKAPADERGAQPSASFALPPALIRRAIARAKARNAQGVLSAATQLAHREFNRPRRLSSGGINTDTSALRNGRASHGDAILLYIKKYLTTLEPVGYHLIDGRVSRSA